MKYNFDQIPDRRGSGCYKWDMKPGLLPLWVADMDFEVAPCVINALQKRLDHHVYGYNIILDEWKKAYSSFYQRKYGWNLDENDLIFATGVVPVLSSAVKALTEKGDNVVVMPPVYNVFYNSIVNPGRNALEVPLVYRDGKYSMDFDGLEKAFALEKTKLCFLCNPGNPSARIWSKEELLRLADTAKRYDVIILSDEIHGPITRPGTQYVPFLGIGDIAKEVGFAGISPSKAFSLAGLQSAAAVVPSPRIRAKFEKQLNADECAEPNSFAQVAVIAALNEGDEWLEQMNEYVFANRDYAFKRINQIPGLKAVEGDATYLLWVDISELGCDGKTFEAYLEENEKVFFNAGNPYGKTGEQFIRINMGTSRENVVEAMNRLEKGAISYGRR